MKQKTGPKRTSIIWQMSKKDFTENVKKSSTFKEILKYFGLENKGSNYKTLKKRLEEENINYSHIPTGVGCNKGMKINRKAISLEKVMIENSTYCRGTLKKRLLKNGMLENKCMICDQLPEHNGIKLVMVLDHINGTPNDHRLENLRLLCPNCNSQQSTFAGKRHKKHYYCEKCGNKRKNKQSKYCFSCSVKLNGQNRRKVKNRPSKEKLLKEIKETNYCAVGRKYDVSDSAIRKWLK